MLGSPPPPPVLPHTLSTERQAPVSRSHTLDVRSSEQVTAYAPPASTDTCAQGGGGGGWGRVTAGA